MVMVQALLLLGIIRYTTAAACPAGLFGPDNATNTSETACQACPISKYQSITGAVSISNYQAANGARSCAQCPPWTYTHLQGSSKLMDCIPCPKGKHFDGIDPATIGFKLDVRYKMYIPGSISVQGALECPGSSAQISNRTVCEVIASSRGYRFTTDCRQGYRCSRRACYMSTEREAVDFSLVATETYGPVCLAGELCIQNEKPKGMFAAAGGMFAFILLGLCTIAMCKRRRCCYFGRSKEEMDKSYTCKGLFALSGFVFAAVNCFTCGMASSLCPTKPESGTAHMDAMDDRYDNVSHSKGPDTADQVQAAPMAMHLDRRVAI